MYNGVQSGRSAKLSSLPRTESMMFGQGDPGSISDRDVNSFLRHHTCNSFGARPLSYPMYDVVQRGRSVKLTHLSCTGCMVLGYGGNVTVVKCQCVQRPSIEPGSSACDLQRYSDLYDCLPTSEAVWCLIGQRSGSQTGLSSQ
jgi:hypothetical protein